MGCGYESKLPDAAPVRPWDHQGRVPHSDEKDERGRFHLPVCPGYACALPDVIETTWAHAYWEKGELTQFCDGDIASPQLRSAIQHYAVEVAKSQDWEMKNPEKKE